MFFESFSQISLFLPKKLHIRKLVIILGATTNPYFILVTDIQTFLASMDHKERKKHFDRIISHDLSNNRWKCLICSDTVSRRAIAIDHIEGVHLQIPSYPCEYCDSILTSNMERRKHRAETEVAKFETIIKMEN